MLAVTDIRLPEHCRTELIARGFSVVPLPRFSALDPRVASHPDMLILPLGNRLFVHQNYYTEARREIEQILCASSLTPTVIHDTIGMAYPHDVALNLAVVGHHILGRRGSISPAVLDYVAQKDFSVINVKQGYAKCATVILGDKAIITADPTIEKAGRALSLSVLRIREGHVSLDGYDHGFLGGASGVCEKTVFFCGDIMHHPDGKNITEFCHSQGFEAVSLSSEPLYDVGTLFFF